jgi:hypothetical protein
MWNGRVEGLQVSLMARGRGVSPDRGLEVE